MHVWSFPIAQPTLPMVPTSNVELMRTILLSDPDLAYFMVLDSILDDYGLGWQDIAEFTDEFLAHLPLYTELTTMGDAVLGGLNAIANGFIDVVDEVFECVFGDVEAPSELEKAGWLLLPAPVRGLLSAVQSDPIASLLWDVMANNENGNAVVWVAHGYLGFREAVLNALISLHRMGADVRVLTSTDIAGSYALPKLSLGGVRVRDLPRGGGGGIIGFHNKSILADAVYPIEGRTRRRQLVWTGSHNLYDGSLEQADEDLVRIEDGRVYDSFRNNFLALWDVAGSFP